MKGSCIDWRNTWDRWSVQGDLPGMLVFLLVLNKAQAKPAGQTTFGICYQRLYLLQIQARNVFSRFITGINDPQLTAWFQTALVVLRKFVYVPKTCLVLRKSLKKSSHTLPCWRHTKLNNCVPIASPCKDRRSLHPGLEMINPHHQDLDFHSWQNMLGAQVAWRTLVGSFEFKPRRLATGRVGSRQSFQPVLAVASLCAGALYLAWTFPKLQVSCDNRYFPPCLCCCVQEWPDCADLPWGQRNSCGLAAAC